MDLAPNETLLSIRLSPKRDTAINGFSHKADTAINESMMRTMTKMVMMMTKRVNLFWFVSDEAADDNDDHDDDDDEDVE